jgi:hypothetical protein
MNQKNILISIIFIILLAFLVSLIMRASVKAPIQSVGIDDNGHVAVSGSGSYAVNQLESILAARGQKPLISGYTDTSVAKFKEGNIILTDGNISGSFVVDMNSIVVESTGKNSGESMLEKHLKSPDFFNVEKYPESVFVIKSAVKTPDDDLYTVTGDLTLKGMTKPIVFPAVIYMKGNQLKAEGTIALDRTLWDIKYGSGTFFDNLGDKIISDIFTIEFKIAADSK